MFRAVVRTFDNDIIEITEYRKARDAYYSGRDGLRWWSHYYKNQFVYLDLPELKLSGCAYTSDLMQTAVIERM